VRVSRGDSQGTRKWFARDNEQERLLLKKAHCSLLLKIAKVKSVSYIVLIANPLLIFLLSVIEQYYTRYELLLL
jgi:hypothetical protein